MEDYPVTVVVGSPVTEIINVSINEAKGEPGPVGPTGAVGPAGATFTFVSEFTPIDPVVGNTWLDVSDLTEWIYYYDGDAYFWVQTNGAPVTGPDPTKVNIAGDTMTGPLLMNGAYPQVNFKSTAGSYLQFQSPAGVVRIAVFHQISDGGFYIQQNDAAGTWARLPLYITESGEVRMVGATAVTVPAPTAAYQAAQVTAINNATGQMAINGKEIGDTGWLDASSLLSAGLTPLAAGFVRLRRVGYTIEYTYIIKNTSGGPLTNPKFISPPLGFKPPPTYSTYGHCIVNGYIESLVNWNSWPDFVLAVAGWPDNTTAAGTLIYTTTDAWPATLPLPAI